MVNNVVSQESALRLKVCGFNESTQYYYAFDEGSEEWTLKRGRTKMNWNWDKYEYHTLSAPTLETCTFWMLNKLKNDN